VNSDLETLKTIMCYRSLINIKGKKLKGDQMSLRVVKNVEMDEKDGEQQSGEQRSFQIVEL